MKKTRNLKMLRMYMDEEMTLREIGDIFGITDVRVGKILSDFSEYQNREEFRNGCQKHSEETKEKISRNSAKYWEGKKRSKETIEKIREANQGRNLSEETKKKIGESNKEASNAGQFCKKHTPWNKGKNEKVDIKCQQCGKIFKVPPSRKDKAKYCSRSCFEKDNRDENHYNWDGGATSKNRLVRNRIEVRLWRESVFARDNWGCQRCGAKDIDLRAHHIKNFSEYPELRTAIENGITLCKECHREFHETYGFRNNNKKQLKEFLNQ